MKSRLRTLGCFLLTLAAIQIALGPKLRLSQWEISADSNAALAEGEAWSHGRLYVDAPGHDTLVTRLHDTAWFNGHAYCVQPPLVTALTVALSPLHRLLLRPTGNWLPEACVVLVFWPLVITGFVVFRQQTGDSVWAGLLTLAWMGGTALLPNLWLSRVGNLGGIDHVLSQVGLLIFAADLLGRRRIWPALIGLAIAVW